MSTDVKELDKIAAEAAGDVAAAQAEAAPAAPQVDPVAALAAEISGLAQGIVAMLTPALPSLATIYTPPAVGAAAHALAAVCVKHGWLAGGVMGEYQEEIMALMICGPLALATAGGVRADLARMKAQAGEGAALPAADAPESSPALEGGGHTPMVLRPA